MIIDSRPRDFSYVNHKESFPLQLKGTMRRKARPASYNPTSSQKQNCIDKDSKLASRIIQNYQDLKSVLPNDFSNQKRKQSIKTYNKQKFIPVSGAAYLMIKSSGQKNHPQRKHLTDRSISYIGHPQVSYKQKRHYRQNYQQNFGFESSQPVKKHSQTLWKKIDNDLYSKIESKQNIVSNTVKISKRNMFTEGINLGYEPSKQPKLSSAKQKQITGNDWSTQQMNKKNSRYDWNRSSFTLG